MTAEASECEAGAATLGRPSVRLNQDQDPDRGSPLDDGLLLFGPGPKEDGGDGEA